MTKEELKKIEARCKVATEGPWCVEGGDTSGFCVTPDIYYEFEICEMNDTQEVLDEQKYANANFIAHSRQDVPDLIREVERLREAAKTFQELSVCHRLRKCPSKTLHARLEKALQILKGSDDA